ncbi:MAG: hypothetical protein H6934_09290 [Burkholderiaceae bacterium]|nr:hypothetical protein [Burkholderiaceae bacterium]
MNPRLARVVKSWLSVGLLALALPAGAEGLGRMFYSPAQRRALEAIGADDARGGAVEAGVGSGGVRYDGLLEAPGRPPTIWLSGRRFEGARGLVADVVRIEGREVVVRRGDVDGERLRPGQREGRESMGANGRVEVGPAPAKSLLAGSR